MAEVINLRIVYETSQAVAGANQLATQTSKLSKEMRSGGIAAVHLAKGLADGNISAVTLARSVEHLGGAVGGIATGVGLAAAAFALWVHHLDEVEKKTAELRKEVNTTRLALNNLLGIKESDTERQLRGITDRIKELQAELNKPTWWDRFKALMMHVGSIWLGFESPGAGMTAIGGGSTKGPIKEAITDLKELEAIARRLAEGELAIALGMIPAGVGGLSFHPTSAAGAAFNRPQQFHPAGAQFPGFKGVDTTGLALHPTVPGPPPIEEELTRQQERIVNSWVDGLHTMQGAVEDFLVTGKFAIQQLIDDFLRIAFRAATDGLIETATNKVIDKIQHSNNAKRLMGIKT